MASYYKKIKGIQYDRTLMDMADSSVAGKGDGRISLKDARRLLKTVKDAGSYTDVEKRTMRYIRDKFKFTEEADKWFRTEVRKWAAIRKTAAATAKAAGKAPKAKKPAPRAVRKKTPAKPARKAERLKDDRFFEREMARIERERVESALTPEGKKGGKRSFIRVAIIFLVIIALIIAFLIFHKKEKPEMEIAKAPTPSEDMSLKEERAVEEEKEMVTEEKADIDDSSRYYYVKVKDDLIKISEDLSGDYTDWKRIYDANRDKIKDPRLIYPGQRLLIPDEIKVKE